jgi:two-component system, chemotaxis family, chemotaxis protein CheY
VEISKTGRIRKNIEMHILIVDDSRTFRYLLIKLLKELGYDDIYAAESPDEAKKVLSGQKYDLIMCDWHMPGETGLDLLKYIRTTPELSKIPFIMITVEKHKSMILEALQIGVQSFLFKPVKKNVLAQKLGELAEVYHFHAPVS